MGADAETLNQCAPAPALVTDPEWTREGNSWVARSANGRFVCTVTHNGDRLGMPWNYTNRFDGEPVANFNDMTEEGAKRRALEQLAAWKRTKPETTERTAPALADPAWIPQGDDMQTSRWNAPCGRLHALVWYNKHQGMFCYLVDGPANKGDRLSIPVGSEAKAKARAVDVVLGMLAELDKVAPPSEPSKWHPIAADIAATVAEKNAAYGDSVTRSAGIMRVLYPDGIPVDAYGDALLVVRVLDKLSRIATDRDALGESPWRDIAGYALRACERGGK